VFPGDVPGITGGELGQVEDLAHPLVGDQQTAVVGHAGDDGHDALGWR